MPLYREAPTYTQPLTIKDNISAAWYRWFQHTQQGVPPSNELIITNVQSPYTYTASSGGFILLTGGTVSSVQFSRTPNVFYATGQTQGMFSMSKGDQLLITFSGAQPSIVFVSQ